LVDLDQAALERGLASVKSNLDKGVEKAKSDRRPSATPRSRSFRALEQLRRGRTRRRRS